MRLLVKERNFSLAWFAGLISFFGDWIMLTALGFFVYDLTGLVLSSGLLFIAYIVPSLLFSSIAGVFVDRLDKRQVMIGANLVRAPLVLLLLFVDSPQNLWIVYVIVFIESGITTFFVASERAFLPNLVSEDDLVAANALNTVNDTIARLTGPVIGGSVLAFGGMNLVIYVNAASYVIGGVLLMLITLSGRAQTADGPIELNIGKRIEAFFAEWRAGLALVQKTHPANALLAIALFTELANSIINVLIVVFVIDILQESSVEFGWLLAARGAGGLVGGMIIAQYAKRFAPQVLVYAGLVAIGVTFFAIFNSSVLVLIVALFVLVGIFSVSKSTGEQVMLQNSADEQYRGRIFGFYGMTMAAAALVGTGVMTLIGDAVATMPLLNVASALFLVAGALGMILLREKPALSNEGA